MTERKKNTQIERKIYRDREKRQNIRQGEKKRKKE